MDKQKESKVFQIEVFEFKSSKFLEENDMVRMAVWDETRGFKMISWVGETKIDRKAYLRRLANKARRELEQTV